MGNINVAQNTLRQGASLKVFCTIPSPISPPRKVLFGKIDPNVSGWGRVVQNFYKSLFYGIFDHFLPGKFKIKIPTFGEKGGVKPVGTKSQLKPKICFEGSPYLFCKKIAAGIF